MPPKHYNFISLHFQTTDTRHIKSCINIAINTFEITTKGGQENNLPAMSHYDHSQLVPHVLHLMNLYKCSDLIDLIQLFNHVRRVAKMQGIVERLLFPYLYLLALIVPYPITNIWWIK